MGLVSAIVAILAHSIPIAQFVISIGAIVLLFGGVIVVSLLVIGTINQETFSQVFGKFIDQGSSLAGKSIKSKALPKGSDSPEDDSD